jgi:hypothetical protein
MCLDKFIVPNLKIWAAIIIIIDVVDNSLIILAIKRRISIIYAFLIPIVQLYFCFFFD